MNFLFDFIEKHPEFGLVFKEGATNEEKETDVKAFVEGIQSNPEKIMEILKKIWSARTAAAANATGTAAAIDDILNDDESPSKIGELWEFVKNTSTFKVAMKLEGEVKHIFETTDIEKLIANPDPATNVDLKNLVDKFQRLLKSKIESGYINQVQLQADVEQLKAKVIAMFGNVFDGMIGTPEAINPSHVLLRNTPDARRQRMLARLQAKVKNRK